MPPPRKNELSAATPLEHHSSREPDDTYRTAGTAAPNPVKDATIESLAQLVNAMTQFNEQFSPRALLFASIETGLGVSEKVEEQPLHAFLPPHELTPERRLNDLMIRTGLGFFVGAQPLVVFSGQGVVPGAQLHLQVAEHSRFLGFLQTLEPADLAREGLSSVLNAAAASIQSLVLGKPEFADAFGAHPQTAISLAPFVQSYERLGLSSALDDVKAYVEASQNGYLAEYATVRARGLLAEPGRFGPADWQKDSTPEGLQERWTQAVETLRTLAENPMAFALHTKLMVHLTRGADLALGSLGDGRGDPEVNAFRTTLTQAVGQLAAHAKQQHVRVN